MAFAGANSALADELFHDQIRALPAGTTLTVSAHGARQSVYWSPHAIPSLIPAKEDDAFEALGCLLTKAVEDRIGSVSRVGALLSGGLDSSALTAIASRSLARNNREIHTFSHVLPAGDKTGVDERAFIEEFRTWPNVRINYVIPPKEAGPFTYIQDIPRSRNMFYQAPHYYVYESVQTIAALRGVQIILDGVGGEHGATTHSRVYFLELALTGRWRSLYRELRCFRSETGISPVRELSGHILNALFPLRRKRSYLKLNPEFVRAQRVERESAREWPDHRRVQAAKLRRFLRGRATEVFPQTIPHSYPLLDRSVLEFCLSAPGSMKVKNGVHRMLIRRALDGVLPARIQWRKDKVRFAVDYFARYNAQLEMANTWMNGCGPKDPVGEVVDLQYLRRIMTPYRGGRGFEQYVQVPLTIYLINFLRQFPEFRR